MAEVTWWLLLITLISFTMNSIIIVLILRKAEQAKNVVTWILLAAIIAMFGWIITTYLQLDLITVDEDPFIFTIIRLVGNISNLIVQILLVNFFRLLVKPRPSWTRNAYLLSLGSLLSGFAGVAIYAGWEKNTDLIDVCWGYADAINYIFIPSVVIFAGLDLRELLNESMSENQRKQVKSLRNGLFLGLLGALPFVILQQIEVFGFGGEHYFLAVALLVITIALFFFIRAYLVDPRVAFIVPHRAYLLIVVDRNGVLKYSKDFLAETAASDSAVLISAGLSAINSMMSEFYETEVFPIFIAFEERKIMFQWSEGYFVAVFTDRDSMLIREAMKQTTKEINSKYKGKLRDVMEGLAMLELDPIIEKTFFFIYQ